MRYVFQFFLLLIFFNNLSANEYRYTKSIELEKDECKKILVKYEKIEKLFKFRWTLFVNGGLVVLRSYDRIVAQNVLHLRHRNQSFRFNLKPKDSKFPRAPYILMKFVEFDYETNKASFMLYLSDKSLQVDLEDLDENKEER